MYMSPGFALLKMIGCIAIGILFGFLPMIDNYSNIFGFFSGLLLSSILFPNIKVKCSRVLHIFVAISFLVVTIAALIVLFYFKPIEKCDWCKFISCPFSNDFCFELDFNITRTTQ